MSVSWKTQAIIGLSSLLCIAIVAGALLFLERKTYGPADLVPADRTLAYLENIDASSAQRLSTYLPWLTNVTDDGIFTVALVRMGSGEKAWIRFANGDATASNPAALSMLRDGAPLSTDASFRALSRIRAQNDAFAYALPAAADLQSPTGLRRTNDPVAMSMTNDETRIGLLTPGISRATTPITNDSGASLLAVHASDLRAFVAGAAEMLTDDKRTAWEAMLRTRFHDLFGEELSFDYDFAPLFEGPGSVTMTMKDGEPIVVMRGRNARAAETIAALHTAAESIAARAERFTRTYDETFTVDNIRAGAEATNDMRVAGGWTVRSSGDAFHSALNGDRFMLSTHAGALSDSITTDASAPALAYIAAGTIDLEALRSAMSRLAPGETFPVPEALAPGARFEWDIERIGDVSVIRLH